MIEWNSESVHTKEQQAAIGEHQVANANLAKFVHRSAFPTTQVDRKSTNTHARPDAAANPGAAKLCQLRAIMPDSKFSLLQVKARYFNRNKRTASFQSFYVGTG